MALIVEDGTNIPNANSYADLVDIRAYALARGITLTAVDADLEVQVIKAMDYLESFRTCFQGEKTYDDQSLQWPRSDVYIDNILIDEDSIPKDLRSAEMQLVIDVHNGITLQPSLSGSSSTAGQVTHEQVGPLVVKYSDTASPSSTNPKLTAAQSFIDILCGKSGRSITVERF